MGEKIILATSKVDKHNDILTKEGMEKSLTSLTGERRLRWLINHRRDLPPLGYISNFSIQEDNSSVSYLIGETFHYDQRQAVEWDNTLIIERSDVMFPFIMRNNIASEKLSISLDKSNFPSLRDLEKVKSDIYKLLNGEVNLELHGRKALINVPEIVIQIAQYYPIYLILKPILLKGIEKFSETIGEKLAEDSYATIKKKLKAFAGNMVRVANLIRANTVPQNKRLVTIFEIPGKPQIHLIIRSDDPTLISKGLTEKNVAKVGAEIEKFSTYFDIEEITFILNEKGHWGFGFLVTEEGATVGKRTYFKERDKLYNSISLQRKNIIKEN